VFNKIDLVPDAEVRMRRIVRTLRWTGRCFAVSALSGAGCREVSAAAHRFLSTGEKPELRASRA
ncbi:MAG: hypothetical protein ACREUK_04055, partial [Burkholderiales bacterium]